MRSESGSKNSSPEDNIKNNKEEDNDNEYREDKKEEVIDKHDRIDFKSDENKTGSVAQENGGVEREEEEGEEEEGFIEQDIVDELFICVSSKFMSEQVRTMNLFGCYFGNIHYYYYYYYYCYYYYYFFPL